MVTEPGRVVVDPQGSRLVFIRHWDVPVGEVWAALTEPARTARWIGTYDGAREPGGSGTFTMTHEAEPVGEPMTVVECATPRRLALRWSGDGDWAVELDLSEAAGTSTLVFTQTFPGPAPQDVALGWHWYLDRLDAEVRGVPGPPGWDEFLAVTAPRYSG